MDVNVLGTQRLLDAAVEQTVKPFFVLCSSSSVYGERSTEEFIETDAVDRPLSPYAASKIAAEAAAFAAHRTCGLSVLCVRPFTVYGPRQRPDLAIHKFCHLIEQGEPIELYGDGTSRRDYTFVADIVDGIYRAMHFKGSQFEIINLGRSEPVSLSEMVESIERALGKKARIVRQPFQVGDVPNTYASIEKARRLLGYEPQTSLDDGIAQFVSWYRQSKLAVAKP
jgi:UDP-glucuronate 4-epimerase